MWDCMRNKTIYLLGDSTLRNWYKFYIMPTFQCSSQTEAWTEDKWHKPAICDNRKLDLTVGWFPHSMPFSTANNDENRYVLHSIARRVDEIPASKDAFVVINLYAHILPFHHGEFQTRMRKIRDSVARLLERNHKVTVFIKAPHTFVEAFASNAILSDFYGYVYMNIMYKLFNGLHDKVILLNQMDATDALQTGLHPREPVDSAMVLQMLSFAC